MYDHPDRIRAMSVSLILIFISACRSQASTSLVCDGGSDTCSEAPSRHHRVLLQKQQSQIHQVQSSEKELLEAAVHDHTSGDVPGSASHHVCIVARTCGALSERCAPGENVKRSIELTNAFLASILAQSFRDWELHMINAEGGSAVYEGLLQNLDDSRLVHGPNLPAAVTRNTFGYEATNHALNELLHGHDTQATCDYFLFTNADNLYSSMFLQFGLQSMVEGFDLIGFNFVTKYGQFLETNNYSAPYVPSMPMRNASFNLGHIDLGAVLVSGQAIQWANARFPTDTGSVSVWDDLDGVRMTHDRLNISDWLFFDSILKRPGSRGRVMRHELPYIHQ